MAGRLPPCPRPIQRKDTLPIDYELLRIALIFSMLAVLRLWAAIARRKTRNCALSRFAQQRTRVRLRVRRASAAECGQMEKMKSSVERTERGKQRMT